MRIAVVGTGYVGLVTGTCLADIGNDVTCIDIDRDKIERLRRGEVPIYEPGLAELVERNHAAGRLNFTTDLVPTVRASRLVFLAVGTPPSADGSADLSTLWTVVDQIAPRLSPQAIVITKSTVPVGTCGRIQARLTELTGRDCDVASNPEFLKEGAAIDDFMKPDRVVVGVRNARVADVLRGLYAPFLRTEKPFLVMSPESAEMAKYVANALLATKISFINEVANLCERMAADIDDVRRGIGHDSRIGFAFLFPGAGYGGSCFPKDVQALAAMAREQGIEPRILDAVHQVNSQQKSVLGHKIAAHFGGNLLGRTITVWGLAFKPRTDDIREAPALVLIDRLLELGATVRVHDPEAMGNVRRHYGNRHGDKLQYAPLPLDALDGADALAIVTEWPEFRHPDFDELARRMKGRVIFDGRNLFSPAAVAAAGFTYHCIGKATTAIRD
jgi:UDPglucose 6-dehydrogenase